MNRPDKHKNELSKAEKELGGIPSSTSVIAIHAEAIESYIERYVGYDYVGTFREMEMCQGKCSLTGHYWTGRTMILPKELSLMQRLVQVLLLWLQIHMS